MSRWRAPPPQGPVCVDCGVRLDPDRRAASPVPLCQACQDAWNAVAKRDPPEEWAEIVAYIGYWDLLPLLSYVQAVTRQGDRLFLTGRGGVRRLLVRRIGPAVSELFGVELVPIPLKAAAEKLAAERRT